jgi:hypothetical protein
MSSAPFDWSAELSAGLCTLREPLSVISRPEAALLQAQIDPNGKVPPGMPLVSVILLCAGERLAPPNDLSGTRTGIDQAEKKRSQKLNLLTPRNWRNSADVRLKRLRSVAYTAVCKPAARESR